MQLELAKKEFFGEVGVDLYKNDNGEIFMTIEQLAQVLEYSNRKSVEKIVERNEYLKNEEFSATYKLSATDGKAYETRIFTEDGLYEVTMISKQPKALEFRAFVRKLLKGLRKNELTVVSNTPSYMIDDPIARAEQWITEYKEKVVLEEKIVEYTPKVKHYEDVMSSENLLTTTAIAKGIGMSARDLNATLHKLGVQFKMGNQWHLYSKYDGKGYTKSVTSLDPQGKFGTEGATHVYTKWTFKGREFIYDILRENGVIE